MLRVRTLHCMLSVDSLVVRSCSPGRCASSSADMPIRCFKGRACAPIFVHSPTRWRRWHRVAKPARLVGLPPFQLVKQSQLPAESAGVRMLQRSVPGCDTSLSQNVMKGDGCQLCQALQNTVFAWLATLSHLCVLSYRRIKSLACFGCKSSHPSGHRTICKDCQTFRDRLKRLPDDWPAERRSEQWLRDALQVCWQLLALLSHDSCFAMSRVLTL